MKTWIAKLRISAALDRPSADRQPLSGTDGTALNSFEKRLAAVDRRLRGAPPSPEVPDDLHASVMRAVRKAERQSVPRRSRSFRWAVASACACLMLGGLWSATSLLRSRLSTSPFSSAASAKFNTEVAELPSAVFYPLSREWQSINLDLEKTAEFLLANVP